jgi:hypothetical protein
MAVAFTLLFATANTTTRAALVVASLAYVAISIMALRRNRWAVVVVVLVAALLLIRFLPPVLLNGWMFLRQDPLYLDSPGTILVVALSAMVIAFPALILVGSYAYRWRALRALIRSSA